MAKREGVNKSAAIREYLAQSPDATAKEIVPALADKGIEVSAQAVSSIRHMLKQNGAPKKKRAKKTAAKRTTAAAPKKNGRKKKTAKRRTAPVATSKDFTATDLAQAKKLADSLGGISTAQKALETLDSLR